MPNNLYIAKTEPRSGKLPYEDMYAYYNDDAEKMVTGGNYDVMMKNILTKYKALEARCEFVLCEGTDFTGVTSAFESPFVLLRNLLKRRAVPCSRR